MVLNSKMIRSVVLIVLVCSAHSIIRKRSVRPSKQPGKIYDVVKLEVTEPPSPRNKRSADLQQLPQSLKVNFAANGDRFKLRLRRTADTSIPVYKLNNDQLTRQHVRNTQSAAIYEDVDTGSHVLVQKLYIRNLPQYTLNGHVVLNSGTFSIKPQKRDHVLRNVDSHFEFGNDEIFLDGAAQIENISTASKKAEIDKILNGKTSVDKFTIETLFVVDHTLRERFLKEYVADDVDGIIEKYFLLLLYTMQGGLDSVSPFYPKVKIVMEKSGLIILDNPQKAPFLTRHLQGRLIDMDTALDEFSDWIQKMKTAPKHDHAMWLTGADVASGEDESVVGAASMGGLCTEGKVSLVEDDLTGLTALTMIHELGHNLNADHDVDHEKDGCSDSDMYIMASSGDITIENGKRGNPFKFSYCSATDIVHFLYKRESAKCTKIDDNGKTVPLTPQRGGQYFDADEQCRLNQNNTESHFCRYRQGTTSWDDMCVKLICYNVREKQCVSGDVAYEHTSCGDQKWCVQGRCVKDADAPSRSDNCPQLDEFGVDCDYDECDSYSDTKKAKCCETCADGEYYY